jgi:hypothetical protein
MSGCWNYINALECILLVFEKNCIHVINARNMEHLKLMLGSFWAILREPKVREHLYAPIYAEQRRFLMPLFFVYKEAYV